MTIAEEAFYSRRANNLTQSTAKGGANTYTAYESQFSGDNSDSSGVAGTWAKALLNTESPGFSDTYSLSGAYPGWIQFKKPGRYVVSAQLVICARTNFIAGGGAWGLIGVTPGYPEELFDDSFVSFSTIVINFNMLFKKDVYFELSQQSVNLGFYMVPAATYSNNFQFGRASSPPDFGFDFIKEHYTTMSVTQL